jgi:hypothetical protein
MAEILKHQVDVPVSVEGENTGEKFTGKFTFKTRLSHKERLTIDILRRQYLGAQPEGAVPSADASATAQIMADLDVRIISAPSWWTNSDNGKDLADNEVLYSVFNAAVGAERKAIMDIKEAAAKAKKDLEAVDTKE